MVGKGTSRILNRLKVLAPLCFGLALVGVFVYLIWDEVRRGDTPPAEPEPAVVRQAPAMAGLGPRRGSGRDTRPPPPRRLTRHAR